MSFTPLSSLAPARPPASPGTDTPEESFIKAFRSHPGGVVVITGLTPAGDPVGFTATSLASLSAQPPRATFNIAQSASSWPAVAIGSRLAVHFLDDAGQGLARRFATTTAERFRGDHWYSDELGLPILRDAVTVLITRVSHQTLLDLNAMIVLDIERGRFLENESPLLYHNRSFTTVAGRPAQSA
ncbi:MAG: flavin reductase family protein [Cryobacterium sp.]